MGVTITLSEKLAAQLQLRAAARQVPLERLAEQILERAVEACDDDEWTKLNRERMDLIRTQMKRDLSDSDKQRLQSLQDLADRRVEDLDRKRLAEAEEWFRKAQRAVGATTDGEK
jgi:hypothetical protein